MSETGTELPPIGAEVLVRITPSIRSDQSWTQVGQVLTALQDPIGLNIGTIKLARPMTTEENPCGWQTDDRWNGCDVAAVFNKYSNVWSATRPLSDRAKEVWAKCWEADCKCVEQRH